MASITSGLYRLEVDNKLPTSPQDLASKGLKILQKWSKSINIRPKINLKS
jgi:hypothetical protein